MLDLLQDPPDRPGRLRDVRQEFGERLAHRERLAALFLGRQHVVNQRAAMQTALLLPPEGIDLGERRGRVRAVGVASAPCRAEDEDRG